VYFHFRASWPTPLRDIYVEVDPDTGFTSREIGLDSSGAVVHRFPSSAHRFGDHRIFDAAVNRFETKDESSDLTREQFDSLWSRPDLSPVPEQLAAPANWLGTLRQSIRGPKERDSQIVRIRGR
jgi:hypothetical protein